MTFFVRPILIRLTCAPSKDGCSSSKINSEIGFITSRLYAFNFIRSSHRKGLSLLVVKTRRMHYTEILFKYDLNPIISAVMKPRSSFNINNNQTW